MESDGATLYPATFSISKRPSLRARLKDSKPILYFFLGCFLFGFLLPPLSIFLGTPFYGLLASNSLAFVFSMLLFGIVAGLAAIFCVRYISHVLLGGSRKRLKELENKLMSGNCSEVVADLDAMISENLKLGRGHVAEFYSRQLLSICEKHGQEEEVPAPELMLSTSAWVSTPDYHKSINYYAVWLFESRGLLCLTSHHLEYESSRISFRVDLKDIVDIGVDKHPWWMKPYPLHFIRITFQDSLSRGSEPFGRLQTLHLTPYTFEADTVWDINVRVKEWYNNLTKALGKVC